MFCQSISCLSNIKGVCSTESAITLDRNGTCILKRTECDVEEYEIKKNCKMGYSDCVLNPLYLAIHHPKWWEEMGSRTTCRGCKDGSQYDDEDK